MMAKTLKEELEGIAGPGMTDMRRVGKWLEILTAYVAELMAWAPHASARSDFFGERITALVDKREQDRKELMSHAGRLADLEAHYGAQLKAAHDALAREVNTEVIVSQEMDIQRLHAENAVHRAASAEANDALREVVELKDRLLRAEEAATSWATNYQNAQVTLSSVRAENAHLRERVATLEKNTWPAPQPIETAPLGQLMLWDPSEYVSEGFGLFTQLDLRSLGWVHEWPNPGMTVEEWRALLKTWGRTHWLPMPPPPGGGK